MMIGSLASRTRILRRERGPNRGDVLRVGSPCAVSGRAQRDRGIHQASDPRLRLRRAASAPIAAQRGAASPSTTHHVDLLGTPAGRRPHPHGARLRACERTRKWRNPMLGCTTTIGTSQSAHTSGLCTEPGPTVGEFGHELRTRVASAPFRTCVNGRLNPSASSGVASRRRVSGRPRGGPDPGRCSWTRTTGRRRRPRRTGLRRWHVCGRPTPDTFEVRQAKEVRRGALCLVRD
jgi:hypothetical protein